VLLLAAVLGMGLTSFLSGWADANQWQRHRELCVEEVCRHLSPRDCDDVTEVNRVLQACAANYDGACVRTSCGLLSPSDCNDSPSSR